jgi:DNA replicative helicase MCM subunit Mcm2 (Cdc46/Mcm family)
MKCPDCGDQFAIIQACSMVKEYVKGLPVRPKRNLVNMGQITDAEVKQIRELVESTNILSSFNENES